MGPLKRGAGDSGLASPAMSSGNATPRSSAVMEISNPNLGTTRSSVLIPTDRVPSTFAILSASMSGDDSKYGTSDAEILLTNQFSCFTQSISEIASITIQRDLSKATVERKEKEYEKWQVHGGDFSALSEEQDKELQHRKAVTAQLDQKLKRCEENRDHAVKAIVSSVLVCRDIKSVPLVEFDSTKGQKFEEQLAEFKHEIQALKSAKELADSNQRERRSSDAQSDSRWTLLGTDLDRIRTSIQSARTDLGLWKSIQEDVAHMKTGITSLESQQLQLKSLKSIEDGIANLRRENSALKNSYQALKDTFVREDDLDPGLLQQLELRKRETEEVQQRISKLEEQIDCQSNSTTTQNSRIESLESRRTSEGMNALTAQAREEAKRVDGELLRLRKEQEEKDDLVGQEVERLDKVITSLQNNLEETTKNVGERVNTVETTSIALDRRITAQESRSSDLPQQALMNGVNSSNWYNVGTMELQTQAQGQNKVLEEHNSRLVVCETVIRDLQSRYDNLSTADLAKSMVHQMQTMYPYPAAVFAQIEQLGRSYALSLQSLGNLSTEVGKLSQRLNTLVVPSNSNVISNGTVVNNTLEKPLESHHPTLLEERLKRISTDLEEKITHFDSSLKLLTDKVEADSGAIQAIANTIDVAKRQYETTVESLKSNMSKLESVTTQKASGADVEATLKKIDLDNVAILTRLRETEDITVKDLASLHGQMTMVKHRLGITQQESNQGQPQKGISEEAIVVLPRKGPSSVQKLELSDSEDDDRPLVKSLERSKPTKKRTAKRRRSHSNFSDYERGHRR